MSGMYSNFGPSNPLTKEDIDPVHQCVGDTWFTTTGIPGARMQKDFCPRFMAQRCANYWDESCEAYLLTSNYDMAGNTFVNKEFLNLTANKKYCRLDTNNPGSHCSLKCESFMPEGQSSVNICENVGTLNWVDTKNEADLAGNFPQSGRLTQLSPLYMNSCPDICDAKGTTINPDALTENDPVLNKCIENGTCMNVLMDLAYNVVKDGRKVTNPAFQKLIEYAKIEAPINPNNIVSIAENFGIKPEMAMKVIEEAKYGSLPFERRTHIQDKKYSPKRENYSPKKSESPKLNRTPRLHSRQKQSVKSSVNSAQRTPVRTPMKTPVRTPTKSPVKSPMKSPVKSPVKNSNMANTPVKSCSSANNFNTPSPVKRTMPIMAPKKLQPKIEPSKLVNNTNKSNSLLSPRRHVREHLNSSNTAGIYRHSINKNAMLIVISVIVGLAAIFLIIKFFLNKSK